MKPSCFLTSALLAATFFPFPLNGQEPPRALEPLESPNDPFGPVSVPSPVPGSGGSASRSTGGVPASACQVPPGKDDTCPVCLSGYVGDGCATCAPGFEFSDGGGECLAGFIAPVESSSSGSGSASSEPTSSESGSASSEPTSSESGSASSVPDSSASSESSSTATDPRAAAPVFLDSAKKKKKKRAVHVISAGSSTGGASSPGSSASSSPVIVLPSPVPVPPGPPASGNTSSSTGSGSGSASDNTASGSEDSAGSALIGRCCVPLAAADPGKNGGNDGPRDGRHIAAEITAYATAGCLVVLFMLFIVMNSRLARTIAEVRAARAAPDSRGNGDASHYQPLHV